MAKTYTDSLTNRTAALNGSTFSGGSATWANKDGANTAATISAVGLGATANSSYGTSAEVDTDTMSAEVAVASIVDSGIALWFDTNQNGTYPSGTGLEYAMFGGTANIFDINSGAFDTLASASHTLQVGTYRGKYNSSTGAVSLEFNGSPVVSTTISTSLVPVGSGKRKSLLGFDVGGAGNMTLTNFVYADVGGSPDVTVSLTGQAVTASRGTVVPTNSRVPTGQSVTASAGTITPARSLPVTGQSVTASRGTISAPNNVTVNLTGQASTAAAGTIVAARSLAVSGQVATLVQSYAGYISSTGYPITLLTSINSTSAYALQASPALSAGDSVRISAGGSAGATQAPTSITINADATWTQTGTPVAFDFQVFDPATQTWGAWATQSIGVTVSVTGQASTSAAGTVSPSRALSPSGQAATASLGAVSPARSVAVTGQAITASRGTLAPTLTIALTGLSATATPGSVVAAVAKALTGSGIAISQGTMSVSAGGNVTVALTGLGATSAVGTLLPSTSKDLTGSAATVSQGNLALAAALQLVGAALSTAQGVVSSGSSVVVNLTGQAMTAALGTLSPTHAAALAGQQADASAGTAAVLRALALLGIPATLTPGTVGVSAGGNVTVSLTGLASAIAQGSVGVATGSNVTVSLSGLAATSSAGDITSAIAFALGGEQFGFEQGTIYAITPPAGGSPDPVPSVEGTLSSPNPFADMLSGEGTLVSGDNGCVLGRFGWASADGSVNSARLTADDQLGFALMRPATWGAVYWSAGRAVLRAGQPMILLTTGDVWARFESGASPGAQVYADKLTGQAIAGYSAAGEPTPWYVVTNAAPGELAVISTTSRVN